MGNARLFIVVSIFPSFAFAFLDDEQIDTGSPPPHCAKFVGVHLVQALRTVLGSLRVAFAGHPGVGGFESRREGVVDVFFVLSVEDRLFWLSAWWNTQSWLTPDKCSVGCESPATMKPILSPLLPLPRATTSPRRLP